MLRNGHTPLYSRLYNEGIRRDIEFRTALFTLLTLATSMCVTITVMDWWDRGRHPVELFVAGTAVATIPTDTAASAGSTQKPVDQKAPASASTFTQRDRSSPVLPTLVKRVKPQYTADAVSRKIEGRVGLSFFVMPNGHVRTIRVIRHLDTGLDRSAIEALSHWRYSPALVNGRPTTVQITTEIEFHLP